MCPQCFCCSVPTLRFKVIVVTASCCLDFLVQLHFKMYLYAIQFLQSAPLSDSDFIVWSALSALGSCVTRPQVTTVTWCWVFMLLLVDVESGADGTEASLMTATVWSALSALGSCVTRPQASTLPPCDLFFSTNLCRKLCLTMYTEPLWQTFSISSCLLFIDVFSSMGYCCPFWGCR